MNEQILTLYGLAQSLGVAEFLVALELASEQEAYGAEYVVAIAAKPGTAGVGVSLNLKLAVEGVPAQAEVERPLMEYERMVANALELPVQPTSIVLSVRELTVSKMLKVSSTVPPQEALAAGGGLRG